MKVAVIGGGAAGFFSAITVKENYPEADVTIFEKSQKLLSKVKISGGGRCNVTNSCTSIGQLCQAYPRGGKKLKKAFHQFSTSHTTAWFESRGVPLFAQDDNRVFPVSQSSQTIIDCFLQEAKRLSIKIERGVGIEGIDPINDQLALSFVSEQLPPRIFNKVIVATGGSPKIKGLEWLEALGHKVKEPVPSLFTFNMPAEEITQLMGLVVENAMVSIQRTKLRSDGPLLITHWGMSGPAVLKLSAFGARTLNEMEYNFKVQINWANEANNEEVANQLKAVGQEHPKKIIANIRPYTLPQRLWLFLLKKRGIPEDKKWSELGTKSLNKLVNVLTNDVYAVKGKTTFKEEFVTCGGVSLDSIDLNTMQSKVCNNLYFAGEVMDVDAITGGYNFQAAWTTGFLAGKLG
ncbi:NAD(P)/FAD-dependent oxidoreductase [Tunicatimonas pelagia]|uniref:NAD(P)/FAD-dependent oxidoreductase n=1 Tax=Tunicatimonas pelagia TaxID=931531 RepID=UPI0026670133|nr:NAD(P)/FAD-dependent oxidoreductase [Tunicatimonas pelagia]WKN42478.1 NAD(P)/FAD-dependent oxidoreductase [Tunicatimonas pelagia]